MKWISLRNKVIVILSSNQYYRELIEYYRLQASSIIVSISFRVKLIWLSIMMFYKQSTGNSKPVMSESSGILSKSSARVAQSLQCPDSSRSLPLALRNVLSGRRLRSRGSICRLLKRYPCLNCTAHDIKLRVYLIFGRIENSNSLA